jgi:K+-sensing histidine kinase KdpD
VATEVGQQLSEYMHEHRLEGWEAGEHILVLLDNTHASEVAVRRAWRLAHALNGDVLAAYPAPLATEQGLTHILTVAMDLNASVRELPGVSVFDELSEVIRAKQITQLLLIAAPAGRVAVFKRPGLADRLLHAHPHLSVTLVAG